MAPGGGADLPRCCGLLGSFARVDLDDVAPALHTPDLPGLSLILGVVATDLATERGGTDANKCDGARQAGRPNIH